MFHREGRSLLDRLLHTASMKNLKNNGNVKQKGSISICVVDWTLSLNEVSTATTYQVKRDLLVNSIIKNKYKAVIVFYPS